MKRTVLIPLATLCIIQALGLIGNTLSAAETEWPFTPMKEPSLPQVKNDA